MSKPLPWSRRHGLLSAPGDQPVRLWTYQAPDALEAAKERGYLCGDRSFMYDEPHWHLCYDYMRDQMSKRLPNFSGDLPIWAWPKRANERWRIKEFGFDEVRLTIVVPRNRVLFSDFELWHIPLNSGSIYATEEEDDEFGDAPFDTETWDAIFDLRPRNNWLGQPERVQACVDRVYLHEIESTRHFRRKARQWKQS